MNSSHVFKLNSNVLQIVKEYKYLGVYFKSNGSFNNCINQLTRQAGKTMFPKARILNLELDVILDLFGKTITPNLFYGCKGWGFSRLKKFELFHRKFFKMILKVHHGVRRTW